MSSRLAARRAAEWASDLTRHVAREGAFLQQCSADGGADGADDDDCRVDEAPYTLMQDLGNVTRAAMDPKVTLPPMLYASLRAASASWVADADFSDAPSPFRAENLDLLQRAPGFA